MTDVFPVQVEWADGYLLLPERPGQGPTSTQTREYVPERCQPEEGY